MTLQQAIEALGRALIGASADIPKLVEDQLGEEVQILELASPKAWQFLLSHQLVSGNEDDGYVASPLLNDIVIALLADQVRRKTAPDVADWLDDLRRAAEQLRLAERNDAQADVVRYRGQVRQLALSMTAGLASETLELRYNLASNFGTCATLDEKLIENRYLVKRTDNLVRKLALINNPLLLEIAGENSFLISQLYHRLPPKLQECRQEMLDAIPRLENMLFKFQEHSEQAKRLLAMERYLNSGHLLSYEPSEEQLADSCFNNALGQGESSFQAHSGVDFYGPHQEDYVGIVRSMRKPRELFELVSKIRDEGPVMLARGDHEEEATPTESVYTTKYYDFLRHAKHIGEPVTVLDFWSAQAKNLSANAFLYHVDTELEHLPELTVERHTRSGGRRSGNTTISNLSLHIPALRALQSGRGDNGH